MIEHENLAIRINNATEEDLSNQIILLVNINGFTYYTQQSLLCKTPI